jgi:hypothetical protein
METKQTPPVGLPTFNDPNRYGEQIITQGQFPEGGMSSGGGGTEIQSFDFPEPDTNPSNKALDPLAQVKAERKAKRRGKRAVNKANRFNKRNPNNKINVPGQTPALTPPPAQQSSLPNSISGQQQAGSSPSYDENANQGGSSYYPGMGSNVGSGNSSLNMMDQQYDQQSPQSPQGTVPMQNLMPDQTAMSYQPPMPGNTQGTARPLFNQGTTNAAQQIYGSEEQRQQSVPGAPLYMHEGKPHVQLNTKLEDYKGGDFYNGLESEKEKQVLRDSVVGKINSGNFRSGKNAYLDGKLKAMRNMHLVKNGFPQENKPTIKIKKQ